jgi:hypothetical protein
MLRCDDSDSRIRFSKSTTSDLRAFINCVGQCLDESPTISLQVGPALLAGGLQHRRLEHMGTGVRVVAAGRLAFAEKINGWHLAS